MKILILGSGGREHAFAKKLMHENELFIAPGNAGTAMCGTNIALSVSDFEGIKKLCLEKNIEMLIPASEEPLVLGIADFFRNEPSLKHILVLGPSKTGAQLEGSKDFSKKFMQKYNIPTARYATFTASNWQEGITFLETLSAPYVLKADGLAAGKGVIIETDLQKAKDSFKIMIDGQFGEASSKVVIEEYLHGIEMSTFVLTDGENYLILPEAKDYKRIGEGDTGLNTGGMGAVSPVPFANNLFKETVENSIVKPTLEGLKQEGIDYVGFIFIGLMNVQGKPYVIEYNCRMGDPETEVVFPRIKNNFTDLCKAACTKELSSINMQIDNKTAVTVFLVSEGYPENVKKGYEISSIEDVKTSDIFQAGTVNKDGKLYTNGGRVMALTNLANNIEDAANLCFADAEKITYSGKYYRTDIGKDLIQIK